MPLVRAEEPVDWRSTRDHVSEARERTERALRAPAIRYADSLDLQHGIPSLVAAGELERALFDAILGTMVFGYRSVLAELRDLRASRGVREWGPQDERLPATALPVLRAITVHACKRFADRMRREYERFEDGDLERSHKLREQGVQTAHVIAVEFVSRALNTGRSLGAVGDNPPRVTAAARALYAMRSEQLDVNTCTPCDSLHGEISQVASDRYYLMMPPNGCVTATIPQIGPRCRGVYVYGDSLEDFLGPIRPVS